MTRETERAARLIGRAVIVYRAGITSGPYVLQSIDPRGWYVLTSSRRDPFTIRTRGTKLRPFERVTP